MESFNENWKALDINTFLPRVDIQIESSHLIFFENQMTGFYIKCNTGLKWLKSPLQELPKYSQELMKLPSSVHIYLMESIKFLMST